MDCLVGRRIVGKSMISMVCYVFADRSSGAIKEAIDFSGEHLEDYSALRKYSGESHRVWISSPRFEGWFDYDAIDASTPDDGGMCIVDAYGRRWRRRRTGRVLIKWFDFKDDAKKIQAAVDVGGRIEFEAEHVYRVESPILIDGKGKRIVGNGALVVYSKRQSAVPSYGESLFNVVGASNISIEDIRLSYDASLAFSGRDYDGWISGIHVEATDYFVAERVEASGFNRAGINIGIDSIYCKNPKVLNCKLYRNRVAGVIFGNTLEGVVRDNVLSFNGAVDSVGTGYGFAGWASCLPKRTIIEGNRANDNFRKGLDFHSGEEGVVVNNVCLRNRVYGIYAMGVRGDWVISGNVVGDMLWNNEFPYVAPYGIRVGHLLGQGLNQIPTRFTVKANTIRNISKTAGEAFAIGESMVGCSYGTLTVLNNIIDVGVVSQIINSARKSRGVDGNYFDIYINSNKIRAAECTSPLAPIFIRSGKTRKLEFSENSIEISAVVGRSGVLSYERLKPEGEVRAVGNSINVPALAWSKVSGPIVFKEGDVAVVSDNLVNGVKR